MEQETRKFAIQQAIILISSRTDITDKTKAVFDLANDIIVWVMGKKESKISESWSNEHDGTSRSMIQTK